MTLLLDENLSPALVQQLSPALTALHVRDLGLARASDTEIWNHAPEHGLVIVSKDADFHQRSLLRGFPPKVLWIRRGNCLTAERSHVVCSRLSHVREFSEDAPRLVVLERRRSCNAAETLASPL